MLSRLLQLLIIAAVVLLLPTFFYLSQDARSNIINVARPSHKFSSPLSGLSGSPEAASAGRIIHVVGQDTQGNGPPPAPGHMSKGGEGGWAGISDTLDKSLHKAEDWLGQIKGPWTGAYDPHPTPLPSEGGTQSSSGKGKVIMGKMANATAKAELGRATWKFLHTLTLRFPDHPTDSEKQALRDFFHLFSRLYPCGECAAHFQTLLEELPPQVGSRMGASLWLCTVHNRVNQRLGKEEFPCDKLDETYDCGCGGPEEKGKEKGEGGGVSGSAPTAGSLQKRAVNAPRLLKRSRRPAALRLLQERAPTPDSLLWLEEAARYVSSHIIGRRGLLSGQGCACTMRK